MLAKDEVIRRLVSNEISISYEFDPTSAPLSQRLPEAARVDPSKPESLAFRVFDNHFFGDRFGLTLGPVVVSDKFAHRRGRALFKNRPGNFDLTKTDGKIEILPGESLLVSTIEYIALGGKTAAYILPRLTLATAGLVLATTYIDPRWEGILQLYLCNFSPHPHELKVGERIAICRFYEVLGSPVSENIKSVFAQKSHHYGLNWGRILDTDAEAQPRRKERIMAGVYVERIRRGIRDFVTNWQNVAGMALVATMISAIFAFARFSEKATQIDALRGKLESQAADLVRYKALSENLESRLPFSGSVDLDLVAGQSFVSQDIRLERQPARGTSIWLYPVLEDRDITTNAELRYDPSSQAYFLRVSVNRRTGSSLSKGGRYRIRWLIVAQ